MPAMPATVTLSAEEVERVRDLSKLHLATPLSKADPEFCNLDHLERLYSVLRSELVHQRNRGRSTNSLHADKDFIGKLIDRAEEEVNTGLHRLAVVTMTPDEEKRVRVLYSGYQGNVESKRWPLNSTEISQLYMTMCHAAATASSNPGQLLEDLDFLRGVFARALEADRTEKEEALEREKKERKENPPSPLVHALAVITDEFGMPRAWGVASTEADAKAAAELHWKLYKQSHQSAERQPNSTVQWFMGSPLRPDPLPQLGLGSAEPVKVTSVPGVAKRISPAAKKAKAKK
jgi:hypothetical protein